MEVEKQQPPAPALAEGPPSLPYAGVLSRIWAAILDLIAIYLLFMISLVAMVSLGTSSEWFGTLSPILGIGISWLYFAGCESSAARATPGKRLARIVVADAQGARISFARASLRFLGKVPLLATLGLALFAIYLDRQRRALDDLIAGTRVLDVEAEARGGPRPWWRKAIGPVILVIIIGLMAKMAIDAQKDFQRRAHTSEAMLAGYAARSLVAQYYGQTGRLPKSSAEAGLAKDSVSLGKYVSGIAVRDNGLVVITLIKSSDWPDGGEITFTPVEGPAAGDLTWKCRSTLPPRMLPSNCRG